MGDEKGGTLLEPWGDASWNDPATVFCSAPWDARAVRRWCMPAAELAPFQPLLGQDAQMALFAAKFAREGKRLMAVAAPEMHTLEAAGKRRPLHLRFGTTRLPRLLAGAVNASVIAEDHGAVRVGGAHPFASGRAMPHALDAIFAFSHVRAPDPGAPAVQGLAEAFSTADIAALPDAPPGWGWPDGVTVHALSELDGAGPALAEAAPPAWDIAPPDGDCVLLPMNMAHPGSVVPDLLDKVALLERLQRRTPRIVVLPFNDIAAAPAALRDLRTSARCVLIARAPTLAAGVALARQCACAWIDATDPEWRFTVARLRRIGLAYTVVATAADAVPDAAADERYRLDYAGVLGRLGWEGRRVSVRGLAALIERATEHAGA